MRLMGSFQTNTIHGTSGSVNVSPTGWSTSTGAVVMAFIVPDATGPSRRSEDGGAGLLGLGGRRQLALGTDALRQGEAQRHDPHHDRAEDVGRDEADGHAVEVLDVPDRALQQLAHEER